MTRNEPKMDHEYDGIEEYDNPIPVWLNLILVGSILFSAMYIPYYHLSGMGELPIAKYEREMELVEFQRAKQAELLAASVSPEELLRDSSVLAEGALVFTSTCASCHGPAGEGDIGPDLTDSVWVTGEGRFEEIVQVVTEGVVTKGMPPWGPILGPRKVQAVAAYVVSLQPESAVSAASAQSEEETSPPPNPLQ